MSEEDDGILSGGNSRWHQPSNSSSVSLKSDRSKDEPLRFDSEDQSSRWHQPSNSSSVSLESDRSKDESSNFDSEDQSSRWHQPSNSSSVSLKSDRSKDESSNFDSEDQSSPQHQTLIYSSVSLKSDGSKDEPLSSDSQGQSSRWHQPSNSSSVSLESDRSKDESSNFDSEDQSSRWHQPSNSSSVSLKSDRSEDESSNFDSEDQSVSNDNQPETSGPGDTGENTKGSFSTIGDDKEERHLKEEITKKVDRHKNDPKLSQIVTFESGEKKPVLLKDLFTNKSWFAKIPGLSKYVRTVLMEGVPGVGKTFQTTMFMNDWAKGNSNKDIKALVTLDFTELNKKKDEVKSMESLLDDFFNKKNVNVSKVDMKKICFILDGLEKCELPLDFVNNKKVKDLKGKASMDVLLTNLIKGNLLPEAHIWIISQPKGVYKIPSKYINKTVLCQGDAKEEEYLKKVILEEVGQHESDPQLSEIVMFESGGKKPVSPKDLFTNNKSLNSGLSDKSKNVRTVLMKGVPGVGKTFQTKMFMIDWAKGNSNKDIKALVTLDFTELKTKKDEVKSMESLLDDFFNKKNVIVSEDDKKKICFILDGLEKCKLPLDFGKNKEVKDLKEAASMDVLLTNLIKGKLLPEAHIWIISQPKGVDKIPSECINKTVLCQGDAEEEEYLKKVILEEVGQHESDPKLSEIVTFESGEKKPVSLKDLFTNNKSLNSGLSDKSKNVRTVLMKGVPGVGKTFQTTMFMIDWAKGNSNKDIKALVTLDFTELKTKKDEVKSMESLLDDFFNKKNLIYKDDKKKICFIIDGLEKCELPLDFVNNKKVKDLKGKASMDVLLTNLIKGNLLPEAHIWIISQPKGVYKIPSKYINKTVLCQGDATEEKYLKKVILEEVGRHESDPKLSEIVTFETGEKKPVSPKDLFTDNKSLISNLPGLSKNVRTVLMKGVPGVGKTFQTKMFKIDWAKGNSNKDIKALVDLDFTELKRKKDEVKSMESLLDDFFNKKNFVYKDDKKKICFILDCLEKCKLPLDFVKNKEVKDLKEAASMDVLLTNLIKGNLLPEAHIWIISQPKGLDKIPSKYINKTVLCQGDATEEKYLKKVILEEVGRHESDPKLSEIVTFESGEKKPVSLKSLFSYVPGMSKNVRTVLMKGVPGIGKTFQTKMFMIDWAKGNSNKDIKALVTLDFTELNKKKDEVKSMESLLNDFFNKKNFVYKDDKKKICFILDGLEKCELPLDFIKNNEVKDLKEAASMDVLLTNLMKENLLPDARIWIISQPKGLDKIPSEYINKTVVCQETSEQQKKLESCLKNRFLKEITDEKDETSHPNQKTTEHVIRRENGSEEEKSKQDNFRKVNQPSEIFKDVKEEKTRTVLTIGEADIGKSFHMKKFIKEWAKKDDTWSFFTWIRRPFSSQSKPAELLFLIDFSKLNLIKNKNISLFELLNRFFEETKNIIISDYSQLNTVFILDGLNAYQHCLDFENSKTLTDVREPTSVNMLLTNLIRGNLLPEAQIWITSQPPAAEKIPDGFIDRLTEIREKPDITSHRKLKSELKDQFTSVSEGIDAEKTSALLNEVFTDLYITEGERAQNEAMQVQDAKFKTTDEETSIKYCDIFKSADNNQNIKTVLTVGVAGIGKTFASMKYMLDWAESKATENVLDWAEGKATENFYFIFPLPFRELNLRADEDHSLQDLIHQFFPAMRTSEITDYDKYKILIVLDGFDECRFDLKFSETNKLSDVTTPTSINGLLSNLILGNLLPNAQIWITSRPAASNNIPPENVDRMTEVRGFNDEQKEKYFMKRFSDENVAKKVLSYVKKSRTLNIMCHIPIFCFITSKVLEDFVERNQDDELPKTLTDMYTHFLLLQRRQTKVKYNTDQSTSETSGTETFCDKTIDETILSLGKLAFKGLEEKNLLFTEEDLTNCGTDVTKAAVFSGLFTQIKRENLELYPQKLFCFVHQSIQEYMAALHVFYSFNNKGENVFVEPSSAASEFYKKAVDKAFESEHGDWDMFLRFLVGLSLESNQDLLQDLMDKTEKHKVTSKEAAEYIKKKIRENSDTEKNLNLFYCLNELNDDSLVKEIKKYLKSEEKHFETFTASQWSALTFVLLTSDENLEVFDLKKYLKSEKVLLGMMPVVKVSNTTLLSWCELSEESCKGLTSSVLTKPSSNLTVLDLSHNDLLDAGVKRLADGLKHVNCKLETLKLAGCQVTEKGCISLAEAIESNRLSSLKHLDLSYNHPGDNGMRALNAIVEDPNKKLETVNFDYEGKHRLKPGWSKYGADLMFDKNSASRRLVLAENNKKVKTDDDVKKQRNTSDERFKRTQVFCDKGLNQLCYWEVEWKGVVGIAVAYKDVGRSWNRDGGLGCNEKSWSLLCSKTGYKAMHKNKKEEIKVPTCKKIGVFLDWEGGTLSYYSISSEKRSLIHTFKTKFTAELFPAFWFEKGSVTLCDL
ncbi:uncharacterized protein LOC111609863 isoform X2 [Xiphophorus maculatus]|uniref:uncharacterized protein LOC111609863 isoform X2 n=1 Tax=Xiphophorus maculatus TaxID=8083 RepID=UPI000C6ED3EE|nr:uncharacterized protein LOC111609863 isoform X2 [Xiphophorus maculatus]